MISKAIARYIRISPRKTRLAADLIRGKSINEAQTILQNLEKRSKVYLGELLKSAIANATRSPDIVPADLYVSKITIDNGPMFKRYRAGSMGRAMMIKHRMSHILIELDKKKEAIRQPGVQIQTAKGKVKATAKKRETKTKVKKMAIARKGK